MANEWMTGVGSLLGAGVQALAAKGQQRRQADIDQKLMSQQFNQNVDMWNMQNAYNSPSAQMKRLQEAGLNPALMYGGKSGGQTGNASSISPVTPQRTQAANYGNAALTGIHAFQDIKLKAAQTDNINSQTEKNGEQTLYIATQRTGQEISNGLAHLKKYGLQLDNETKRLMNEYNRKSMSDRLTFTMHQASREGWQSALTEGEISRRNEMQAKQIVKMGQEIANMKAQLNLTREQTWLTKANFSKTIAQKNLTKAEIEIKKLEKDWFAWYKVYIPSANAGANVVRAASQVVTDFITKGASKSAKAGRAAKNRKDHAQAEYLENKIHD